MKKFLILLSALLLSAQAQAALTGVSFDSSGSNPGGEIIAAVSVQEDAVTNTLQQGFNEQQGVNVTTDIFVDSGLNLNGMRVDSHLIFLNTASGSAEATAEWTFSSNIIGVMSDQNGGLMAASDGIFAAFNDYFTIGNASGFNLQGLETSGQNPFDGYSFAGSTLDLSMHVSEPGDWIRVLTVSEVPVPAALFMFAPALLGFLGLRRKTKTAIA